MITLSIDIGLKNFAIGAFCTEDGKPLEIIFLELFSLTGNKKRATWAEREDNLTNFLSSIIQRLNSPDTIRVICEQQVPRAKANCRIASIVKTAFTMWQKMSNKKLEFIYLHPLQKFPHGLPANIPKRAGSDSIPHHILKAYSKQVCRQHLEAYGYADWIDYIFIQHSDKCDDLCDVILQVLSTHRAALEAMPEFEKPKRKARGEGTPKPKSKRVKIEPLPENRYEEIESTRWDEGPSSTLT